LKIKNIIVDNAFGLNSMNSQKNPTHFFPIQVKKLGCDYCVLCSYHFYCNV